MPEIKQLEVAMVYKSNLNERFFIRSHKIYRRFLYSWKFKPLCLDNVLYIIKRNVTKPLECQISDIHVQVIQASCNLSSGGGLKNREEQCNKLKPGYGLTWNTG